MYTSRAGCWVDEHVLHRGDVVFFWGRTQLDWTMWCQADRIKVQFRSSKGDQLWDEMMVTFAHGGPSLALQDGGGAVDLIFELLSYCICLLSYAAMAAFGNRAW